jgi:hypothetical protein
MMMIKNAKFLLKNIHLNRMISGMNLKYFSDASHQEVKL